MIKRFLATAAFALALCLSAQAQSTTIITGTIKGTDGNIATSGQVTFDLTPGIDATMSGVARFSPITVTCSITGAGAVKALDGTSNCTLQQNTSLQPGGTSYKACIQIAFVTPGSCFNFYAIGTSVDISTIAPTPSQMPAYHLVDDFSNQTVGGNKTFSGNVTFGGSLTMGALSLGGNLSLGSNSISSVTGIVNSGDETVCALCTRKWGSSGTSSPDVGFSRIGVGTLAIGNSANGDFTGAIKLASITGLTGQITPNAAGGIDVGTASLPFSGVRIGAAATNNIRVTGTATGARTATLPDNTGTLSETNLAETFSGAKTFSDGTLLLAGSSSGTTTLKASATASGTLTLPAATGTLARTSGDTFTSTTLTSPTINTPSFSALCNNNNTGCKAQRFGASCTTAAGAGSSCSTTLTWTVPFADANYTAVCLGANALGVPLLLNGTHNAASLSVGVVAVTAAAAQFTSIDCIAIHD